MTKLEDLVALSTFKNTVPKSWIKIFKQKGYKVTRIPDKKRLINFLNSLNQEETMTRSNPLIAISDSGKSLPEFCSKTLKEKGYRIIRIPDKNRLLDLLTAVLPDLIVTDIESPNMDGLELLEEIKTSCRTRDIPVVVTSDIAGFKGEALNLGAKEFLIRPFGIDEFMKAVKSAVGRSPWSDWGQA